MLSGIALTRAHALQYGNTWPSIAIPGPDMKNKANKSRPSKEITTK